MGVRAASCCETVANWVTRAVESVFLRASRNASAALRTSSTAWLDSIEPDASSTSVTFTPHDSSIGGFGAGCTACGAGMAAGRGGGAAAPATIAMVAAATRTARSDREETARRPRVMCVPLSVFRAATAGRTHHRELAAELYRAGMGPGRGPSVLSRVALGLHGEGLGTRTASAT